ncbi:uncharacterized protein SCHCODRAFT_02037899 [Schizophyllum commune H4-8]|uniref:uncharacterized protein n=1 Tax=Schizophyllum commune (strain H4-8 / FGSC 9210) TaxID=578458 RepID=UPI00215EC067|nr:uncharacterized protein SCHCODRAFT_02037899 [Schizophyllum commune H4-8]KAI5900486.1 hypothetical protein SCHCODRAFT_02037899 [Schizophyllum commune H4-8]
MARGIASACPQALSGIVEACARQRQGHEEEYWAKCLGWSIEEMRFARRSETDRPRTVSGAWLAESSLNSVKHLAQRSCSLFSQKQESSGRSECHTDVCDWATIRLCYRHLSVKLADKPGVNIREERDPCQTKYNDSG